MQTTMTSRFRRALLVALFGLVVVAATSAEAGVVATISLSSQRMYVTVDGKPWRSWPVSTAKPGYRTPTGTFKPQSLAVWHRSTIYSGSPMPHSIFFKGGYAIHGSYETKYLGRPASHGCVRLHPTAAAQLFAVVKQHGTGNTIIRIVN